jgi:type I restriction enzyme S subunit
MVLQKGWTLISRSGTIGNCAFANAKHAQKLASEHVIRLVPNNILREGVIYAFLASKYGHSLLTQGTFGAVIQHIEPAFVGSLPIPMFPIEFQELVDDLIQTSARQREAANIALDKAIKLFEAEIGTDRINISSTYGKVDSQQIMAKFYRFDAQYQLGTKQLSNNKRGIRTIKINDIAKNIYIGNRSKRYYVDKNGIPFLSSSDMLLANPKRFCKLISKNTPQLSEMVVHNGTILISRSGTVGNTILVGNSLSGCAVSEHAMRLVVDSTKIEPEYVFAYLNTGQGQDSLKILPYGSVIITLGEDFLKAIDLPIVSCDAKADIVASIKTYVQNIDGAIDNEDKAISMVEQEIEKWNK